MPSIENKKKSQQNKLLYIFLTAFFGSLVIIIYLATALTPEIDVDVNSESEYSATETYRPDIDQRLKDLQQDELIGITQKNTDEDSSSEIIQQLKKLKEETIAKQKKNDEIELETETDEDIPSNEIANKISPANPAYKRQPSTAASTSTPAKMAKVYIGHYSNFDEAIKVQDALVQKSLASAPFIKNMGDYYVIQIGSYSNQQTAQNIAENLISHGYSARMVLE